MTADADSLGHARVTGASGQGYDTDRERCDWLACCVLAPFQPDPLLAEDLAGIVEKLAPAAEYPSSPPGLVPAAWLETRQAISAMLSGACRPVSDKATIPTLRARFLPAALRCGLADLDGGPCDHPHPGRSRAIATWLTTCTTELVDGVRFESRHCDMTD